MPVHKKPRKVRGTDKIKRTKTVTRKRISGGWLAIPAHDIFINPKKFGFDNKWHLLDAALIAYQQREGVEL